MARMLKSNDLEIYETGINFMRQIQRNCLTMCPEDYFNFDSQEDVEAYDIFKR